MTALYDFFLSLLPSSPCIFLHTSLVTWSYDPDERLTGTVSSSIYKGVLSSYLAYGTLLCGFFFLFFYMCTFDPNADNKLLQ